MSCLMLAATYRSAREIYREELLREHLKFCMLYNVAKASSPRPLLRQEERERILRISPLQHASHC